jgi:hypothetical protein
VGRRLDRALPRGGAGIPTGLYCNSILSDRALPEAILGAGLGHQVQDRHGGRIGPGRSTMTTLPAGP